MSKENLELKLSERDIIVKEMTMFVKHLEEKPNPFENDKRLLEKTNKEMMRSYGEQNMVVRRSVGELVKSAVTRFVVMATCISKANTK